METKTIYKILIAINILGLVIICYDIHRVKKQVAELHLEQQSTHALAVKARSMLFQLDSLIAKQQAP